MSQNVHQLSQLSGNGIQQQIQKQQTADFNDFDIEKPKQKKKAIQRIYNKYDNILKQKDAVIRLVLHELKKENGSIEAMQKDKKLKEFKSEWVLKYVKFARHFAVKKDQKQQRKQLKDQQKQKSSPKSSEIIKSQQSPMTASTAKSTPEHIGEQIIYSNNQEENKLQKNTDFNDLQSEWSNIESFVEFEDEALRKINEVHDIEQQSQNQQNNNEFELQIESVEQNKKKDNKYADKSQSSSDQDSSDHSEWPEYEFEIELQPVVCSEKYSKDEPLRLDYSDVFGNMIEDAVNEMNDIDIEYGELDDIEEMSGESGSIWSAPISQQEREFVESLIESFSSDADRHSIPSELSKFNSYSGCSTDQY